MSENIIGIYCFYKRLITSPLKFKQKNLSIVLSLTRKSFVQYGLLKNLSLALAPLLLKDELFRTFSKAHLARSQS